jgi:hypothetical protein
MELAEVNLCRRKMLKAKKGIIFFLILFSSSCYNIKGEPMIVPSALPPPHTYNLGKGEAGIQTTGFLPGPNLKVGLGKHVEISGMYYPYTSLYQLLEAEIELGIGEKKQDIIGLGIGDYLSLTQGYMDGSMYHNNHYYIYQGFYPAVYKVSQHFSVRPLVRVYEYMGNYYYNTDPNGETKLNKFSGIEIVPEIDLLWNWEHFGLRTGLSLPLLSSVGGISETKPFLQQDTSSDLSGIVYFVPMFSFGVYGNW